MRLVIGHPKIGFGGSESTLMWLVEALKRDFDVTVMTTGGWDLEALNGYYGTQVRANEVSVRIAPVPFPLRNLNAAAFRGACYQRYARQIAGEYDVRVSAYNTTDWGLPAVHFIADFSWNKEIRDRIHPPSPGFIYRESLLRKAYLTIAASYEWPSGRDVLRNDMVIANSQWSATLLKHHCDVECAAVVYPPVWMAFPYVAWEEKAPAFVMIGRIAPEKQIERAIAILEEVRRRGHAAQLHLCGRIGNDLYGRSIARLCETHEDWIIPEGWVSGAKKAQILSHCRFGIQTCAAEAFGVTVAEMVKAGAIVFASDDGGQTEILDSPELLFSNLNDAIEKIIAVFENPPLQSTLRAHLANQEQLFSAESFVHEVRALIADLWTTDQASRCKVTSKAE